MRLGLHKTVRIEIKGTEFGETFYYNRTDHVFFRALARKTKTLFRHTEQWRYDGHQRPWYILPPVGRPRPFCSTALVDNTMGNAPYRWRHENRVGGGV